MWPLPPSIFGFISTLEPIQSGIVAGGMLARKLTRRLLTTGHLNYAKSRI